MKHRSEIIDHTLNRETQYIIEGNETHYFPKTFSGPGKKSFLVFNYNKYQIVPTENIAFFYTKYESSVIVCFDRQEYSVNHSLEHIQHLLSDLQFFRLNRQYLINFNAVKEVEHYFARKLLVRLPMPFAHKLTVSKEKARSFLYWLENR
jgi:DNA-binding LytR/AlgR family response regulator